MAVTIVGPVADAGAQAGTILRELPDWFGNPEAVDRYATDLATLPTWLALDGERAVDFLTIRRHTTVASELYVLGVLPEYHRRGLGASYSLKPRMLCATMASVSSRSKRSGRHVRARRMRGHAPFTRRWASCRSKRSSNCGAWITRA